MTTRIQPFLCTAFFLVVFQTMQAQFGFTNEVGVFAGAYNLRSDFGERQNFESSTNTGFGVGLVHYMNFSYRRNYSFRSFNNFFNEHFKIKNELSYSQTNLGHFGTWVDASRISENADRLRAHTGRARNFNIGTHIEFFPMEIRAFEGGRTNFLPFASLGVHYTIFQPDVNTSYGDGDINNLDNFYLPWQVDQDPFISTEAGNTFSIVAGLGTRYKVTPLTDLTLEMRWQYYFNDFVDGLNHKLESNQNNDWAIWLTVGYVIYWER